jgi:hypothetical protein
MTANESDIEATQKVAPDTIPSTEGSEKEVMRVNTIGRNGGRRKPMKSGEYSM